MKYKTPLMQATLVRRYKRFFVDAILDEGKELVTAHCPNPGSLLGIAEPGARIWLEPVLGTNRRLKYAWRLVEPKEGVWISIDTSAPNRLICNELKMRNIPTLHDYTVVRSEVRVGEKSRADFLLTGSDLPNAWVEVKSVTSQREEKCAEFPDSITSRAARHLFDLSERVATGERAVVIFLVQRTDSTRFRVANDIDEYFRRAYFGARASGVEFLCFKCELDQYGSKIDLNPLPILS